MKKIPVLATIREAYRFTFAHLGAIIGLIWLPMIVLTVIGFFVLRRYYEALADALASNSYAAMGPQVLGLFCYLIAALLLYSMMSVPVTQLALGARKQGALVHFAFTATEWRLFRGVVTLLAFLLLPLLALGLAVELTQSGGGVLTAAGPVELLALLFWMAGIYFVLRFGLLLPALSASENGPLLSRAWQLTAGNFWRILAVAAAVLLPVWLLSAAIHAAVEGPQALMPSMAASTALQAAQFHQMAMAMPLASGISFLIQPLLLGLLLGAGASIYRSLTAAADMA